MFQLHLLSYFYHERPESKTINSEFNYLNRSCSDVIQKIFTNLTIGEISRLCRTSQSFNFVCGKELLWKNKLHDEYGVDEKTKRHGEIQRKMYFWRVRNIGAGLMNLSSII